MATEPNVLYRLSIWRDYAPPHPLALSVEPTGFQMVKPEHRLQAEVYSWPLQYDIFAGISKEEVRGRLQELLARFQASRPPGERSLCALNEFVTEAEKVIDEGDATPIRGELGNATVESNPLLAFALHLKWIVRCFKDRPSISVSVR